MGEYEVIIVGAGISGISAGRILQRRGVKVKLLDKGKVPGGRIATRRIPYQSNKLVFDYGCKHLEAETDEFNNLLQNLSKSGVALPLNEREKTALGKQKNDRIYIGAEGIRNVVLAQAGSLDISNLVKIIKIERNGEFWKLIDSQQNEYHCKTLLMTMPVPQAIQLLKQSNIEIAAETKHQLDKVTYSRSIVALITLNGEYEFGKNIFVSRPDNSIAFITNNNRKNVNSNLTALTVEMSYEFSMGNWNLPETGLIQKLRESVKKFLTHDILDISIHRWKYAAPLTTFPEEYAVIKDSPPLLLSGDAFGGTNAESAYLSGAAAADLIYSEFIPR